MTFMTIGEVAGRLGVSPGTVRNWVRKGELPAFRLGPRRYAVEEDALRAFIDAARAKGVARVAA